MSTVPARFALIASLFAVALPFHLGAQQKIDWCRLPSETSQWLEGVMTDWSRLSKEVLRFSDPDVPLIVVIGEECVWRVRPATESPSSREEQDSTRVDWGGYRLRVDGNAHGGALALPNGDEVLPNPMALTSVGQEPPGPFMAISNLPVWRRVIPPDRGIDVPSFVSGIALHELIHSIQIVWAHEKLEGAAAKLGSGVQVDDDMFQELYSGDPAYEAAYLEERAAFIEAIRAEDSGERVRLTREAVGLFRDRQEQFFLDHPEEFRLLQDVFLTLEGASVWGSFQIRPPNGDASVGGIVDHYSKEFGNWIQDEAAPMATLVSQLVPSWIDEVYRAEPALLIDLLERYCQLEPVSGESLDEQEDAQLLTLRRERIQFER